MAQHLTMLDPKGIIAQDRQKINDNFISLATSFAGETFPTSPYIGMTCYRTDLKRVYRYVDMNVWRLEMDLNNVTASVATAGSAVTDQKGNIINETYARKDDIFVGATSANNGKSGLVPAPMAGEENYVLRADGTWGISVTINGKKPDTRANISILDMTYPIGSIYMSVIPTNPADLFGGSWEALSQGRVLIGAGGNYSAGTTGGEETHTLTANEMPKHRHNASSGSSSISMARHYHGVGSYNIGTNNGDFVGFYSRESFEYANHGGMIGWNGSNDGGYWYNSKPSLNQVTTLDKSYGSTTTGSHNHSVTLADTGDSQPHNIMQPYLVVYMWKRVA